MRITEVTEPGEMPGDRISQDQDRALTSLGYLGQSSPTSISEGARGEFVLAAQRELNRAGLGPLEEDGVFGPLTKAAVMRFQARVALSANGVLTTDQFVKLKALPTTTALAKGDGAGEPGAGEPGAEEGGFLKQLSDWLTKNWMLVGAGAVAVGALWYLTRQSGGVRAISSVETLTLEDGLDGFRASGKASQKARRKSAKRRNKRAVRKAARAAAKGR